MLGAHLQGQKSGKKWWSPGYLIAVYRLNYVQSVTLWQPHCGLRVVLVDLILYVPSTIFQLKGTYQGFSFLIVNSFYMSDFMYLLRTQIIFHNVK